MAETRYGCEKPSGDGRNLIGTVQTLKGRQKIALKTVETSKHGRNLLWMGKPLRLRRVETLKLRQKPSIGGKTSPSKERRNNQSTAVTLYTWENPSV